MAKVLKVTEVNAGSQGYNAGIRVGDIILAYNGVRILGNSDFTNAVISAKNKGLTECEITILRGDTNLKINVATDPLGINTNVVEEKTSSTPSKSEYGVARGMCSLFSFIGWALVVIGVVIAFVGLSGGNRYGGVSVAAILPGIGTIVSGFLTVMGAQVTRATVDNADHTREILLAIQNNR